ncbi:hypothetical protein SAMN05421736_12516 [Evansella caseinilytica]|uniref:Uncharacterized protein n=1 Tax=Evansella caseinilytica TaxID=1503961 RepID=A0A1H3URX9_9BACI|nr:hypothetical protein [Evansella caseinilytica]SDZ65117.1 hypothetical protein SAMN05421736_12516 [Evansella caseinilytica]
MNAEDQVKIATIEKKLVFAKDDQIILFVDESGGVGYAMMKNGKMETVVYGDMEQGYDQVNNFFIAYGKKPDKENTELTVVIHTDNNHRDIQKSFPLEQGSFYLVAEEIPEDITHTRVLMENYQFK